MPSLYPSLIHRLQTQHETIKVLIAGLPEERLHQAPQPGKWNIHQQLAHLGSYQPVFLQRVEAILTTENPAFDRYRADDDPVFAHWSSFDTTTIVEKLEKERAAIAAKLLDLSAAQLQRRGSHPKLGEMNLVEWTESFLLHEAHHLFAVFQLVHTVQ